MRKRDFKLEKSIYKNKIHWLYYTYFENKQVDAQTTPYRYQNLSSHLL